MINKFINSLQVNFPILEMEVFYNSITKWTIAVIAFILAYAVLKIFKVAILAQLKKIAKKTKNEFDDVIINGLDAIHWPFNLFISVYVAQYVLYVSEKIQTILYYILIITVSYYLMRVIQAAVDVIIKKVIAGKKGDKDAEEMVKMVSTAVKIILWVLAALLILSNLGYNVNSLIAGFGVGGIVIAFAVQKIVSDLFSSLSIHFDKPFSVDDYVIIGTDKGTVNKIGMRATRLTSSQGEELVIPNSEIVSARIQNYGKMKRRRIAFSIGVTYDTPEKKLEEIPEMIKSIIKAQKNCEFDRCYFKDFGDFSLGFDIVYFVESGEYVDYLKVQQAVNLAIVEIFEKQGIEMAFPTQTIHIAK